MLIVVTAVDPWLTLTFGGVAEKVNPAWLVPPKFPDCVKVWPLDV
jgi:hypothetical protein